MSPIYKWVTFDGSVTVDLELIQRRQDFGGVSVVVVGPGSNGVAADIGVRNPQLLYRPPNLPLLVIHCQTRLHWIRPVNVMPKLRWQEPLQPIQRQIFCFTSFNIKYTQYFRSTMYRKKKKCRSVQWSDMDPLRKFFFVFFGWFFS